MAGEHNLKKYKENRKQEWSNLPPDLLRSIIPKLHFADRIRFLSVCKDWHNIPVGDRPINELPWVISHTDFHYNYSNLSVMLYDPFHKKTFKIPNFLGIFDNYVDYFYNLRICASKCGWLLFSSKFPLFLYNPFQNYVIRLPSIFTSLHSTINYSTSTLYQEAAFSFPNPSCLNRLFVVVICYNVCVGLRIFTYRDGDSEWRTKAIDEEYRGGRVTSVLCSGKGVCYFVLQSGKLGAFCVNSQKCTWLVKSEWPGCKDTMQLVEFNGDLLLVKCSDNYYDFEVFRYDVNGRGWIRQETLGNRALFVSPGCSYIRPAIGDTSYLADKIIFHHYYGNESEIRVYSLKKRKLCKESCAYGWMVKNSLQKVFIEPPY